MKLSDDFVKKAGHSILGVLISYIPALLRTTTSSPIDQRCGTLSPLEIFLKRGSKAR